MSNAASLAAAKKRRSQQPNVHFQERVSNKTNSKTNSKTNNDTNTNTQNSEPTTPNNLLRQHDYRLFCLEKQFGQNENYITKNDLELFKLNNSVNSVNSNLDNKVLNNVGTNSSELASLKLTVTQLNKNVTDMNGVIQMLRATVMTQTNELTELKQFKENNERKLDKESEVNEENEKDEEGGEGDGEEREEEGGDEEGEEDGREEDGREEDGREEDGGGEVGEIRI